MLHHDVEIQCINVPPRVHYLVSKTFSSAAAARSFPSIHPSIRPSIRPPPPPPNPPRASTAGAMAIIDSLSARGASNKTNQARPQANHVHVFLPCVVCIILILVYTFSLLALYVQHQYPSSCYMQDGETIASQKKQSCAKYTSAQQS